MMPRRVHRDNAAKQRAYRERQRLVYEKLERLKVALCEAAEAGRSARLTNHLDDNPDVWLDQLCDRLEGKKLLVCNIAGNERGGKRHRKATDGTKSGAGYDGEVLVRAPLEPAQRGAALSV
jgi:hypothetical protein